MGIHPPTQWDDLYAELCTASIGSPVGLPRQQQHLPADESVERLTASLRVIQVRDIDCMLSATAALRSLLTLFHRSRACIGRVQRQLRDFVAVRRKRAQEELEQEERKSPVGIPGSSHCLQDSDADGMVDGGFAERLHKRTRHFSPMM
jgi:hypothetical protein